MTDRGSTSWSAPPPVSAGPAPGLMYGGFWIRTLAYLIDTLLLIAAAIGLTATTGITFFKITSRQFHSTNFNSVGVFVSPTLAGFLLWFIYFCGLWTFAGQTVGMVPFGLRVVRAADGRRLGPGRAIGRFLGLLLSFVALAIGVIWVAADRNKQGWHDKLARTVVVRGTASSPVSVASSESAPEPPADQ